MGWGLPDPALCWPVGLLGGVLATVPAVMLEPGPGQGTPPRLERFSSAEPTTGCTTASGSYLPLPGSPPPPPDASKTAYLSTEQRGVYAAQVAFDRPGVWGVEATVDLDGQKTVRVGFKVRPAHQVPAPGEAARCNSGR